ncbi:hypothetical protein PLICRDRAFT_234029 [Plicaturopsis crispa FD-325 SS-3]|nr:hypothetical protein PLICRDRAFT_234029 [Plicaturopsis crispa FD-325 SS-3]
MLDNIQSAIPMNHSHACYVIESTPAQSALYLSEELYRLADHSITTPDALQPCTIYHQESCHQVRCISVSSYPGLRTIQSAPPTSLDRCCRFIRKTDMTDSRILIPICSPCPFRPTLASTVV